MKFHTVAVPAVPSFAHHFDACGFSAPQLDALVFVSRRTMLGGAEI